MAYFHPSSVEPDVTLRDALTGQITVGANADPVKVYGDWERPTNGVPDDFVVVFLNGDIGGVGMRTDYADGNLMVSLYCKMNDDGSVKKNRIKKILEQFDLKVINRTVGEYFYTYDSPRFITPTTPNQTSGYSVTTLNLRWHTTNDFNRTT